LLQEHPVSSEFLVRKEPVNRRKELLVDAEPVFRILRAGRIRVLARQEFGGALP
jgi:hypothetical protein